MEFFTGREFLEQEIETVPWLIHPMVPGTGVVLFHGAPGVGKSGTMWQMANAIETGKEFLHWPSNQARVLFVSLDMPKWGLYNRWKEAGFEPLFDVAIGEPFDCTQSGFELTKVYGQMKEQVDKVGYGLIIVDALGRVIPASFSDDSLPNKVYKTFEKWFPNACIVFIHHDRKRKITDSGSLAQSSEEDQLGSQLWRAYATVTLHLWRVNSSIIKLEVSKSQVGPDVNSQPSFDPIDLYMSEKGMGIEVWSEHKQQKEAGALMSAEAELKEMHPNWEKMPITKRVRLLSTHLGKSIPTINRWRRSLDTNREVV